MNGTTSPHAARRLDSIRGVPLESPFTLAALSGYSDLGMRVVCRALGACVTRNEVVLDQFIMDDGRGARSGKHLDPGDRPIAAQLMGNDPETMGQAAARMVAFGYDFVDINFGCPVKKVLGRCRGGFLLSEPETAIAMMEKVVAAVDVPVTVKMRRGKDDSQESRDRFWQILDRGVELGIAGVTVHGRTVLQRYDGPSQWGILAEVKQKYPDLVLFGSGDLFTAEDCLRMIEETGCDGVTIARGAINNPWIFRECLALWRGAPKPAPPTVEEQADLIERQLQLSIAQYGPERATRQMRKFGIKQAHLHPRAAEVQAAVIHLSTPQEWQAVRKRYYGSEWESLRTVDS